MYAMTSRLRTLIPSRPRLEVQDPKDPSKEIDELVKDLSIEDKERNHDPLTLVANSYAIPSYSRSPQPYYVTYPPSEHDYDDDYQGEIQGDAQEDKLSTTLMLLAQAITQYFSTTTNNHLHTSSNTRNQAVIQDVRVDIQRKNVRYASNGSRNTGRITGNQGTNAGNGFAQKNVEMMRIVHDSNAYGEDQLEELNASVIMMAHIQPTDNKSNAEPTYDVGVISEHITVDDQLDSDIIFDDPYVEVNSGQVEHDQDAPD
ncbi:hypothetical protein Tco_0366557 [Tanacetum coccineum]